jgi:Flp pilus assembly protein TadG
MGLMSRRTPSDSFRNERGANLVEMAIVLPFLLLLLAGVIDLGRAFYTYLSLTNAVREGARFAAKLPYQDNEDAIVELVIARVREEPMQSVPADAIIVEKPIQGLGGPKGSPVTVRANLLFDPILGPFIGRETITITTEATMRIFGVDGVE